MKLDLTTGLKTCSKCKVAQTPDHFAKDASTADGLFHLCKTCASRKSKVFYYNHQTDIQERVTAYNLAHKDDPVWDAYNASAKDKKLRKLFGISLVQFTEMWDKQQGLCPICGSELRRHPGGHAVDHDHRTDKVRALLCQRCNVVLGFVDDNADLLASMSQYCIIHSTSS
jgi:hypothetical protein